MKQIIFTFFIFIVFSCKKETKVSISSFEIIIEAISINFNDLDYVEKKEMIFTNCCCYPENWHQGVNCVEKENAFYVKAKINFKLLAALSESETFTMNDLISSNPHSLYGKYHNRWQFIDEDGYEICETSKHKGHNNFRLIRNDTIDEIIIGPLPKKPIKMLIDIVDSKYYKGIIPEMTIKN